MADKPDNSSTPIFPSPLTSIEKFHFYDDRFEFPNNLFCRLRFAGTINREMALEAVKFIEKRHPMMNVRVDRSGDHLEWTRTTPASETLEWEENLTPPSFRGLDVTQNAGVQLLFKVTEDIFEIWVQAHHATLDGGGGIQIANDWMIAYDNLFHERPVDEGLPKLNQELLRDRNNLGLKSKSYLKQLWKQPIGLLGATKFLFRRFGLLTNSIVHRSDPRHLHNRYPVIHGQWLSPETVLSLKNQGIKHKASLNAILMSHLFSTVHQWRTEHQHGRPEDWLRFLMPISIRGMWDRRLSAANRSSVVQIDRRPMDFARPDLMAQGLDFEIGLIRNWQLNKAFLIILRMMSGWNKWLKSSAKKKQYRGTLIFTNLGFPHSKNRRLIVDEEIKTGELKLKYFDWVGPLRRGLGVNFTVQQHFERLRISMHVDTRQIDFSDARELFDAYVSRLNEVRI